MNTWLTILIAVLPAAILLVYIYFQDVHEKEPIGLLLKIFLLGALSTVPTIIVEYAADAAIGLTFGGSRFMYYFVDAFLGVALVEEFFKFMAAYLLTWRNKHFNYKFDGIVYCLFGSMGFAALENILYLFRFGTKYALGLGLFRGVLAIPAHAMCAIFMGYFYGNAKYMKSYGDRKGCRKSLFTGYIIAVSLHGFYDFCLMYQNWLFLVLFVFFVIAADIFTIIRIHKAKKEDQRMYEEPKYRQYIINPANPYELFGGYAAPVYGAYSQPDGAAMSQGAQPGPDFMGTEPNFNMQNAQYMPNHGQPPFQNGGQEYAPNMGMQYASNHGRPPMQGNGNSIYRNGSQQLPPNMQPQHAPDQGMQYAPNQGQQYTPNQGMQYAPNQGMPYTPNQGQAPSFSQNQGQPAQPNQGSEYSPFRGTPLEPMNRNVMMHCPVCGEVNHFKAFTCRKCGASLHQM